MITFLRHGRSVADDEGRFEGLYDSPLTDLGRSKAATLAEEWKKNDNRHYDLIVCSPLKRAVETAEILSQGSTIDIKQQKSLAEIDPGKLSGLLKKEGLEKYPPPLFANPYDRMVEGSGESEAQIHARALIALEEIINLDFNRALVVAHGGILNAIARMMMGSPIPVNRSGVLFKWGDLSYLDTAYQGDKLHQWIVLGFKTDWDC